jgi:hypothetical protein
MNTWNALGNSLHIPVVCLETMELTGTRGFRKWQMIEIPWKVYPQADSDTIASDGVNM